MRTNIRWTPEMLAELKRRYLAGATYKELGDELGVTRERIRQVLTPTRAEVLQASGVRAARLRVVDDETTAAVREHLRAGHPVTRIARELRVPLVVVETHRKQLGHADRIVRHSAQVSHERAFSDTDLVAAVRYAADVLHQNRLSGDQYHAVRQASDHPMPSVQSVSIRLGWNEACRRAGLEINDPGPEGWGTRRYSDEDAREALMHVTRQLGRAPTEDEYTTRRRSGDPVSRLISQRHRGWNPAKLWAQLEYEREQTDRRAS